jgi:primosomal protein N' (replication factor Y)
VWAYLAVAVQAEGCTQPLSGIRSAGNSATRSRIHRRRFPRRELGYPPFRHLVRIVASGPDQAEAMRLLEEIRDGSPGEDLIGPAPLLRLRGRYRAQLVGKSIRPRRVAQRAAELLAAAAPAMCRAELSAVVDVDPQGF